MNLWIVILIAGLLTVAIRASLIFLFGKIEMPAWLQRCLKYVPPAVLSALILPEIFVREGVLNLSPLNPRLISALLAGLVAWRTKNVVLTLLAGMAGLIIVQLIFR